MKKGNDLGKGIATAGIWVGVALSGIYAGVAVIMVALLGMLATMAVWEK
jgi:hypothetical protein